MSGDAILDALSRLETGLESLRDGQTELRRESAEFREQLTMLRRESGEFREQVLNRLGSIRDDIAVNMARVDLVADANADIRGELLSLRKENAGLWRMLRALETRVEQIETSGS